MDFSKSGQNEKFIPEEENESEITILEEASKPDNNFEEQREEKICGARGFRTLMSQILAATIINLILLDLGMVLAFPTIIIPDLLKSTKSLKFTEEEASWFGSVAFICQPLGSLFSGFLFDPVGRKKTMFYINLPLLVGWLLIYFGATVPYLFVGEVIMGVGIGFMDAPHITYLGEITQPKWRGILTSYAEISVALGFCLVFFMGTTASWRTVSAICSAVPIVTMLLITQIPESPIWLLSKGRKKEAEKSLCWLRGWVEPEIIQKEFSDLIRHNNATFGERKSSETESFSANFNTQKRINYVKISFQNFNLTCLCKKSVLRPLFLVVIYFGFSHAAGVTSTRPFMVEILEEFGTPLNAKWVTAISSVIGITGLITGMTLLPKTGKRILSLISMFGCAIICSLMAIYGIFFNYLNIPLFLVSLFVLLNFIWSVGIGQIPWMLISEVFPFKGRGVASGISAALSYVQAFIFTKTYYATHNSFNIFGVFGFYGIITLFGGLFLYFCLPETEGKTLEQIERIVEDHFNKFEKTKRNLTEI